MAGYDSVLPYVRAITDVRLSTGMARFTVGLELIDGERAKLDSVFIAETFAEPDANTVRAISDLAARPRERCGFLLVLNFVVATTKREVVHTLNCSYHWVLPLTDAVTA